MIQLANKYFYRPKEISNLLSVSRTEIYNLLKKGKLMSVQEGSKRLITRQSLLNYVNELNCKQEKFNNGN